MEDVTRLDHDGNSAVEGSHSQPRLFRLSNVAAVNNGVTNDEPNPVQNSPCQCCQRVCNADVLAAMDLTPLMMQN